MSMHFHSKTLPSFSPSIPSYSKKPCVYKLIIQRHIPVFWELCREIGSHPGMFDRPVCEREEERRREGEIRRERTTTSKKYTCT